MITKVGIAGGGILGSAIATVNLQAGYDVVIFDLEESQLLKAKGRLNKIINEFNLSAAVKYADNISSMKDCNLIIECLTEDENTTMMSLSGVKRFPMRVKCATLAWHTFIHAAEGKEETAVTE